VKSLSDLSLPKAKKEIVSSHSDKMVDYLSRSLILEERGVPNFARLSVCIVLFLIFSFFAWAHVTPVQEVSFASGAILPENFVQPVQHLEGGIIKQIHVKSGDWIEEGAPIVTLDEVAFKADWEQLKVREATLSFQIARLRALVDNIEPVFDNKTTKYNHLLFEQKAAFYAQKNQINTQINMIENQLSDKEKSVLVFERRKILLQEQLDLLNEEVNLLAKLVSKKLAKRTLLLQKKQETKQIEGNIEAIEANIIANNTEIKALKSQKEQVIQRQVSEAQKELSLAVSQLTEIKEQLKRLDNRVARLTVPAPISGRVKDLRMTSIGAIVEPAARIAEIVPESTKIFAEIEVSPKDIGFIKAGMNVFVKVDTFDYSRYGGVEGILETISASSFTKDNGQIYFKGRVKLDADRLLQNEDLIITPGMTVVTDIQTGEKTIMSYLVRPLKHAVEQSFYER